MARLIDIEGTDFAGYRYFKMALANQGLTFIAGMNKDSDSASSNGACKTGLFKALGWGLYGQAVDRRVGDEIIHHGQTCARVRIRIEDKGDSYTVIRERRKQAPKLFLEHNGEPVKRSKADIQLEIDRLIGVDWQGFRSTVLYGQGDRDRFVYPTTSDSQRKEVIHRILKTGIFSLCFREARTRRSAVSRKMDTVRVDLEWIDKGIGDIDLDSIGAKVGAFDDDRKRRSRELAVEARELAAKARSGSDSIEDVSARLEAAEDDLEAFGRRIDTSSQVFDELSKEASDLRGLSLSFGAEISAIEKQLKRLSKDKCPTCSAPLTKGPGRDHKKDREKRLEKIKSSRDEADSQRKAKLVLMKGAHDRIEELSDDREATLIKKADLNARVKLADEQKALSRRLASLAKSKLAEAKSVLTESNPYDSELEVAEKKISKFKKERKAKRKEKRALEVELSSLEFWARGFGPSGIQSYALDSVMPFLTERANDHLYTLSNGDMSINFTTQRELKSSKEKRDQIGITWVIEGIENYPPSGGQWKKLEIATNFAMMDLVATREGSHVGILCLDECLDGLDSEGKQRVIDLLHKLRSIRESIFVISHDEELSEVFERTLIVTKEDGVSKLEVA